VTSAMAVDSRSPTPGRARRRGAFSNPMVSTVAQSASESARSPEPRLHLLELLLIVGLAGVFMVNAVVALLEPSEFTGLFERSFVGRVIPALSRAWVAWVIAVHDLTVGVAILATMWIPRTRPFVLAWAGAWLLGVALVKLTALEAVRG
jgi:hypothetical protein